MRRGTYTLIGAALFVCAAAGWGTMLGLEIAAASGLSRLFTALIGAGALCAVLLLRFDLMIHELGHLLFGILAGLRVRRVSVGWVSFGQGGIRFGRRSVAGETQFTLRKASGAHARLAAAAAGGSVLGLVFGGVMLVLYVLLPAHPALSLFAQLGLWCLPLALSELMPAELTAGKTDGLVLKELAARTGETEVSVRVMLAQLLLQSRSAARLPRELLFEVPVVREDSPAFCELLALQAEYLHACGDEAGEAAVRARLAAIREDV